MGSSKRGLEWPKSLVVGAAMGGGFLAVQSAYAQDSDPFRMQELSSGYMLAANRFVPTGEGDKKNQEGALCASMGSANDKNIEEGRCAYSDPDSPAPEEGERKGAEKEREEG